MKRIFILGMPRSGSHFLHNILWKGCGLNMKNYDTAIEIFNGFRDYPFHNNQEKRRNVNNTESAIEVVDESISKIISIQSEHFIQRNIDIFKFANYFKNSIFIVLNRVDSLSQYISLRLAEDSSNWILKNYDNKISLGADNYYEYVKEKTDAYYMYLKNLERSSAQFSALNYYEDVYFKDADLEKIFLKIGIEFDVKIKSNLLLTKQRKNPIASYLNNPEALDTIKNVKLEI